MADLEGYLGMKHSPFPEFNRINTCSEVLLLRYLIKSYWHPQSKNPRSTPTNKQ